MSDSLKDIISEVGKDLVLDDFNLKAQSLRLPARKHYWVAQLIQAKVERNQTLAKKQSLKKNILKTVIESSPVKLSQSAAERAAECHESIATLTAKLQELDIIIEYLDKVTHTLNQMGYDIKNVVEIMKLEQM